MLVYSWYARTYNWTPQQVDELSVDEMEWIPLLAEAVMDAQEVMRKQEEAQNSRR